MSAEFVDESPRWPTTVRTVEPVEGTFTLTMELGIAALIENKELSVVNPATLFTVPTKGNTRANPAERLATREEAETQIVESVLLPPKRTLEVGARVAATCPTKVTLIAPDMGALMGRAEEILTESYEIICVKVARYQV